MTPDRKPGVVNQTTPSGRLATLLQWLASSTQSRDGIWQLRNLCPATYQCNSNSRSLGSTMAGSRESMQLTTQTSGSRWLMYGVEASNGTKTDFIQGH